VNTDRRNDLIGLLADLEEDVVLATVRQRMAQGDDPLRIIEDCQQGMREVGERYEQGHYYLSALIMAGEILREVMEQVQPVIEGCIIGHASGRILIGTVWGDIHDIGKNIASMLLACHGFTVYDLGVDVPPDVFAARFVALRPQIVGLSGLLSSSYDAMRETVALLRAQIPASGPAVPIIIGGGLLNEQVCQYVGADHWITDAMNGVRLCQEIVAQNHT
jgi:methanogenic corrinoid protein MtbC1